MMGNRSSVLLDAKRKLVKGLTELLGILKGKRGPGEMSSVAKVMMKWYN